jgi:hypothetical protein
MGSSVALELIRETHVQFLGRDAPKQSYFGAVIK